MGVTFGGESQFLGATLLVGLFQIARSLACLFGSQRPILTGATPAPPGPGHWPGLKLPVMYGRMYGASYILYGAAHTCMVRAVLVRAY